MIEHNAINQILGIKERVLAPYNGLDVAWFDAWHPALDEALQSLPEMETCPHDLFRLLNQNPGSAPKKIALVTKGSTPVAVVPLRQLKRHSYEVPTWMIPGAVFPAQQGYLIPALDALGIDVCVTWRRMGSSPPPGPLIRYLRAMPVHLIRFSDDYERYWRETGHFKTVRHKRNKCQSFDLAVNSPGSAEWTLRHAAEKWRDNPARTNRSIDDWAISDWIVAANYWEKQGRHYTLMLLDQGTPIGGATLTVHHNDAVGGLIYRKPEYEQYGVGVRLMDLCFSFAAESGYAAFDLGGAADYKEHWAPQQDELWFFSVCPEPLFRAKQAVNHVRVAQRKLVNWFDGARTRAS